MATAKEWSSAEEESSYSSDDATGSEDRLNDDFEQFAPQLSDGVVLTSVVQRALSEEQSKQKRCTPNIKALAVSACLFTLITILQVFAARMANSQALLMDCISMAVDALTYFGNIFVECRKRDGRDHVVSQLTVVAISLTCLTYFTWTASMESVSTIRVCRGEVAGEEEDGEVNGWITLTFALGGVLFDMVCLVAFYRSNKKAGNGKQINMFSALLHVSADSLRSVSTLVMSLLLLFGGFDAVCLDAYTSLLIGVSIALGAVIGFYRWLNLLTSLFRRHE